MTEFGASATLTVEVDKRSVSKAKDYVEEEFGTVSVGASRTFGRSARTDGGRGPTAVGMNSSSDILEEQLDVQEDILDELEQGVGGGGGGLGGIGAGGLAAGASALSTVGLPALAAAAPIGLQELNKQLFPDIGKDVVSNMRSTDITDVFDQPGRTMATAFANMVDAGGMGQSMGVALIQEIRGTSLGKEFADGMDRGTQFWADIGSDIAGGFESSAPFGDGSSKDGVNEDVTLTDNSTKLRNRARSDPLTDPLDTGPTVTTYRDSNQLRNMARTGTLPTRQNPTSTELNNAVQAEQRQQQQTTQQPVVDISLDLSSLREVERELDRTKQEVQRLRNGITRGGR